MRVNTAEDFMFWIMKYLVEFMVYGRDNLLWKLRNGGY